MIETVTSFTIVFAVSPAVDTGTTNTLYSKVYNSLGPDMGWKESGFTSENNGPFYVDDSGNDGDIESRRGLFSHKSRVTG